MYSDFNLCDNKEFTEGEVRLKSAKTLNFSKLFILAKLGVVF